MTITDSTPIGDIAAAIPSSVRIFQRHEIDFCCGGKRALGTVCAERGLSVPAIVTAIKGSASAAPSDRDWMHEPLSALIEHIVVIYHDNLREELPRLQGMASKVARIHGVKTPTFIRIAEIVEDLSAELVAHMRKEETILFPTIRAIEEGRADTAWIKAPVSVMEREHDHAGALLEDLRELTRGFAPPDGTCATTRALYHGLEQLERSMHVHVHLENNILFPRALQVEATTVSN